MKKSAVLLASTLLLSACAHEVLLRRPASESAPVPVAVPVSKYVPALKAGHPWNAADPMLRRGDLTVWKLQEMAKNGQFDELNDIFNHGLTMDHLPVGYSAGAGVPFPGAPIAVKKILDELTGYKWRGKIFYDSGDPANSHGFNRILKVPPGKSVLPTAKFLTHMIDPSGVQHDFDQPQLATGVTSNFVVLNYADPDAHVNWFIENTLKLIPVYDVMVAVPGKYGPLYVGKTWWGKYDKKSKVFHAYTPDTLIAWYFLDFNQGALEEQEAMHWQGGSEQKQPTVDKK